jgi:hypothetical protein
MYLQTIFVEKYSCKAERSRRGRSNRGPKDGHATLLALLGLDHQKLTYRYAGRDFRLTDVAGYVVKDIIA